MTGFWKKEEGPPHDDNADLKLLKDKEKPDETSVRRMRLKAAFME
jgi:hypothetical protein